MRKVAFKGLLARRTRIALTALAVALGVTLISGTYVFTDTINKSFDQIFTAIYAKTDVVVVPDDSIGDQNGGQAPALPDSVVAAAAKVDGVAEATGAVSDQTGVLIGEDGKAITSNGPPTIIGSTIPARFSSTQYDTGRPPRTADEIAIDTATADKQDKQVGDTIALQAEAPKKTYRIVGVTSIEGASSTGGATLADLTLAEAQRVTGKQGKVDEVRIAAADGVTPEELRDRVRQVAPRAAAVRTGAEETEATKSDIEEGLSILTTALLAFAGIALFVGAFIIFNTFSITVAQRAREFALLRTLGASRAQVLRSVLTEGFVLGVLGSVVGLGLGILVAKGLRGLFQATGVDLPSSGTVILSRTIIVALVVGIVVTVVASLVPALRATRVPPVAALREGVALPETKSSRFVLPIALVMTALGFALMALGLFGGLSENGALSAVGAGAAVTFLGVALLSPKLVGPIASVVGRPLELGFGTTGRLARENTVRQPGRTAVTAAALMIGVALVTFASIFAAGAKATINDAVDQGSKADVVMQNASGFGPFSAEAARAVRRVDGVSAVSPLRFAAGAVADGVAVGSGKTVSVSGIDPASFNDLYTVDEGADALRALGPGEVVVAKSYADDNKTKVGDVLEVLTPTLASVRLRVTGIAKDDGQLLSGLIVSAGVAEQSFNSTKDAFDLVKFDDGADAGAVKARIDEVLDDSYPQVQALTADEFKANQADQVDQILGLIYALLALAIIVSLFGIVNTLVLSITERTRELGMLRAIGTTRRQVRAMIRYEAIITALIGGVLGLVLGVVLAILVTQPIDDFALSIPIGNLIFVLIMSAVAGVLAAILPARRAARMNVLEALAYE